MIYTILKPVLWLLFKIGLRLHVEGEDNIPAEGPLVIASNHLSLLDPPVIGAAATAVRRAPLCFSKASSCVHLISDSADRLNDFRLCGVVLYLLTQTLDIYRQRIVVYISARNIPH